MLPVFLQARASDAAVRGAVSQAPRTGRQLLSLLTRSPAGGHRCRRVGQGCLGRRPGRAGTRRWRAWSPRSRRSRTEPFRGQGLKFRQVTAIVGSDIRNHNPRVGVRVPPPAWLSVLYELLLAAAVVATLSKFGESNGACRRPTSRTPRPGDTRSAHRNVVTGGCSARSPVWRVAGAPRRFGTHLPLRLRATPAGRRQRRCFRSGARA